MAILRLHRNGNIVLKILQKAYFHKISKTTHSVKFCSQNITAILSNNRFSKIGEKHLIHFMDLSVIC